MGVSWLVEVNDLARLPMVHGPEGRIAYARRQLLRMSQRDLARELVRVGGRCSRETVSHWENLDKDGLPRSRATRRNAAAIAALLRERVDVQTTADMFFEPQETAWDRIARRLEVVLRQQAETCSRLDAVESTLQTLVSEFELRARADNALRREPALR